MSRLTVALGLLGRGGARPAPLSAARLAWPIPASAFLVLSLLVFAAPAHADPVLIGRWQSDAALSLRFNEEHTRLGENARVFIRQSMGRQTLTFTATTLTQQLASWEHETNVGTRQQMPGWRHVHPYRKLGSTAREVAVEAVDPSTERPTLTVFNFEGPDTLWVYAGGSGKAFPDSHLREYFVRVNSPTPKR
ncbi:MAG: hypothetical protein RLZZ618_1335 [Pseudomonadota bacterium]